MSRTDCNSGFENVITQNESEMGKVFSRNTFVIRISTLYICLQLIKNEIQKVAVYVVKIILAVFSLYICLISNVISLIQSIIKEWIFRKTPVIGALLSTISKSWLAHSMTNKKMIKY